MGDGTLHGCPTAGLPAVVRPRRLSQVLRQIAERPDERITIGEIRDAVGDRGFAMLLVLFACLNLLPLPPGSSLILGLPLIIISWQMVCGRPTAWLPRFVLVKSIDAERFRTTMARILPRLEWLERLVRPRRWPFGDVRSADRGIGAVALVLSVTVTLPIPLGNWLPAMAIGMLGLALSERDGVFLAAGGVVTVLAYLVIAMVVSTAGVLANAAFGIF